MMVRRLWLMVFIACTTLMAQADSYESFVFKGMVDGKVPIEIALQTSFSMEKGTIAAGYILYPNATEPTPLLTAGTYKEIESSRPDCDFLSKVRLQEFQSDGALTARIELLFKEVVGDDGFVNGKWVDPSTGESLPLTDMKTSTQLPEWYPGAPKALLGHERDDYTFQYTLKKEGENLKGIHVEGKVGNSIQLSYDEPLSGPFKTSQEKEFPWIMEADINFDGNPDFLVFLGIKETEHDKYRSFYEAFVWNAVTRQFHHVAKFKELFEPYVDPETKTIKATVAEGSSVREEIYQWKFGKLVLCEKSEP